MTTIVISVAGEEIDARRFTGGWLFSQLERRGRHEGPICARITIDGPGIAMTLATLGCGPGGGSRRPNRREAEIVELWNQHGLSDPAWEPARLIVFVNRLQKMV